MLSLPSLEPYLGDLKVFDIDPLIPICFMIFILFGDPGLPLLVSLLVTSNPTFFI